MSWISMAWAAQAAPALEGKDAQVVEFVVSELRAMRHLLSGDFKLLYTPSDKWVLASYTITEDTIADNIKSRDSHRVFLTLMKVMKELGIDPVRKGINVSLTLIMHERKLVGSDALRTIGKWQYNATTDSATWTEME